MADWQTKAGAQRGKPLPTRCEASGCDRPARTRLGDLAFCGLHEQRWRKHGATENPPRAPRAWRTCSIDDCKNPARTREGRECEMHYYRWRRNGHFDLTDVSTEHFHSSGYRVRKAPGHPLARQNGWVFEHRLVAFGKYGPGDQTCHWCGQSLEWPEAVIDHLNEEKADNTPDNLVVACSPCNRARGSMIPFLRRLLPERMEEFIATFEHMRRTTSKAA